jgi:hypothetical protein
MIKSAFFTTLLLASSNHAFVPRTMFARSGTTTTTTTGTAFIVRPSTGVVLQMTSDFDFPSAMPEKPQLTMDQRLEKSADDFIETMTNTLGEGVKAPPELEALKQARVNNDAKTLALRIYELMIERGMLYDEAPETGTLTHTEFDIPSNLEVKEVQDEFKHLYQYGMMLMNRGFLTEEDCKMTVVERLIKRTGLTPEEFDSWLGY